MSEHDHRPGPGGPSFKAAFGEWVEACWFGESTAAGDHLDDILRFPAGVLLTRSVILIARLLPALAPPGGHGAVAAALAEHLLVSGPDPDREARIRDVVEAAGGGDLSALARHDPEAIAATALECASFLTQTLADHQGVTPASVVRDL